jgi:protein SCO1/2
MRLWMVSAVCLASVVVSVIIAACGKPSDERQYTLQGQVLSVTPAHEEATIKHEEIKGLMPAMTMPYKVKDVKLLDGIAPGDLITATLTVVANDAYLTAVKKVGQAPLEQPPAMSSDAPASSGLFVLLKPGDAAPDAHFVDQNGRPRDFSSFRGSTVVLTFIYTRCPMPTYCPLMDRHFIAIQKKLEEDPALGRRVHLVSVSFDPIHDTPPVLAKHAAGLHADPKRWTFLTGDRDEIDRFASRFGLSIARPVPGKNDQDDITHTLRTAIVDAGGKVVKVYTGNEWTPEQLLADLK